MLTWLHYQKQLGNCGAAKMSDDQNAATLMEEIQKMRQEMLDLKTKVKTAEDRVEKAEEVARNAEAGRGGL